MDYEKAYHELKAAVVEYYRVKDPGCRKDMPYKWALFETKKAGYRLKVLVGLVEPDKIPERYR